MAEEILSFDEYAFQMTKKIRLLRHFERCIFSVWCADRVLESHVRTIEEDLSKSDRKTLQAILDALWEILLSGSLPSKDVLNELDAQFMDVQFQSSIDRSLVSMGVLGTIGFGILGCRRNDVGLAETIGEEVIKVLDFELEERDSDYAKSSLSQRFRHPTIKQELEVQLAMIRHLRGDYALDEGLRFMFQR